MVAAKSSLTFIWHTQVHIIPNSYICEHYTFDITEGFKEEYCALTSYIYQLLQKNKADPDKHLRRLLYRATSLCVHRRFADPLPKYPPCHIFNNINHLQVWTEPSSSPLTEKLFSLNFSVPTPMYRAQRNLSLDNKYVFFVELTAQITFLPNIFSIWARFLSVREVFLTLLIRLSK